MCGTENPICAWLGLVSRCCRRDVIATLLLPAQFVLGIQPPPRRSGEGPYRSLAAAARLSLKALHPLPSTGRSSSLWSTNSFP